MQQLKDLAQIEVWEKANIVVFAESENKLFPVTETSINDSGIDICIFNVINWLQCFNLIEEKPNKKSVQCY